MAWLVQFSCASRSDSLVAQVVPECSACVIRSDEVQLPLVDTKATSTTLLNDARRHRCEELFGSYGGNVAKYVVHEESVQSLEFAVVEVSGHIELVIYSMREG